MQQTSVKHLSVKINLSFFNLYCLNSFKHFPIQQQVSGCLMQKQCWLLLKPLTNDWLHPRYLMNISAHLTFSLMADNDDCCLSPYTGHIWEWTAFLQRSFDCLKKEEQRDVCYWMLSTALLLIWCLHVTSEWPHFNEICCRFSQLNSIRCVFWIFFTSYKSLEWHSFVTCLYNDPGASSCYWLSG